MSWIAIRRGSLDSAEAIRLITALNAELLSTFPERLFGEYLGIVASAA